MKTLSRITTVLTLLLLYAPLLVMIVFSFNDGKSTSVFSGFSFHWYQELLAGGRMIDALRNSLVLAIAAAVIATVLGLLAAIGIFRMKNRYAKAMLNSVTNIPMMNPDIVTGISMLLFFVFVGTAIGYSPYRNFFTVLIAHITFCLPYVILSIMPRLMQMDKHLTEAALDLGCTPLSAFFRIELPAIMPGVLSGFIMAFTLSLDDFVISNFTCGQGFQTLPVYIYNMIKKRVTPDVYALYTIIFLLILALLVLSNVIEARAEEENNPYSKKNRERLRAMQIAGNDTDVSRALQKKRKSSNILVRCVAGFTAFIVLGLATLAIFFRGEDEYAWVEYVETPYAGSTLYVYNWGEYIADGTDGTQDLVEIFKRRYDINVVYDTYDTNETLYSNLKSGAGIYDLVFPSDYMVERLRAEGLLQKIDTSTLENYHYIAEDYRNVYYDPTDEYSVPYNVGMVGIVYDATAVSEEDIGTWELLWNANYRGNILNFDGSRDCFATAQLLLGIDLNTHDRAEWDRAYRKLVEQKAVFQGYVMDQVFGKMEDGSALIAPYYAGDCLSMMDENEDLMFFYPEEGTNIFIDAMCIPTCAQNVGAAHLFIDFLLDPEIAEENALYLYYASPNTAVIESESYREALGEDYYDILYTYPESYKNSDGSLSSKVQYYHHLPDDVLNYVTDLWGRLKQQ